MHMHKIISPYTEITFCHKQLRESLQAKCNVEQSVLITDAMIAELYPALFEGYKTIVLPTGEDQKSLTVLESVVSQLIEAKAHRNTFLIGIGGGTITDITGFVASIYMRGISFGFVPTTLLCMVDAAIGGKNGVNFGLQKNFLGTIRQPKFILCNTLFFGTLPDNEWSNGFAEIIKYACLFDEPLFDELLLNDIAFYKKYRDTLEDLIHRCINWKNKIVIEDEREISSRKLLNFGHTVGHAIEMIYNTPHGHAVSLGMIIACALSERVTGLNEKTTGQLVHLLQKYNLPTNLFFDTKSIMNVLKMDKKRNDNSIDFIILENNGQPKIKQLPFDIIEQILESFSYASYN